MRNILSLISRVRLEAYDAIKTLFSCTTLRRENKRKLKFVQTNIPAKCFDN